MESVGVQYLRTRWFVSEITLICYAYSFHYRHLNNSCVNTARIVTLSIKYSTYVAKLQICNRLILMT